MSNEDAGPCRGAEDPRSLPPRWNPLDVAMEKWRAPSERIRTASEIPIEVDLTDKDAIPIYMKISEKVLHLRRLGMEYAGIAERIGVNVWMAERAARWGKTHLKRRESTPPY